MHWTIGRKLLALGAGPVVVLLLVCGVGIHGLREIGLRVQALNVAAKAIQTQMEADMMHDGLRGDVLSSIEAATDAEAREAHAELRSHAETFRADLAANEQRRLGADIERALAETKPALDAYIASAEAIAALAERDRAGARARLPEFQRAFKDLEARMEKDSELMLAHGDVMERQAATTERRVVLLLAALTVFGAGLLLAFAFGIARGIRGGLDRTVRAMRDVASGEGDLTRKLPVVGRDELTDLSVAFNAFLDNMRTVMLSVRGNAERVAQAALELQSASGTISESAQTQASSLEETTAALERMTTTVRHNADNASQANQLADGAREVAEKGGRVVGDAVHAMREIHESSKKIADITTTIDEIAFQTNLLALNAAVEAARAGEQGRGFAVVASEVRGLAQRSASAAREIKTLIDDSVKKVESGAELVNRSGSTLTEIVASVTRVTDIVAEISAASHEQSRSADEVSRSMGLMDRATQSNAAQTEELSATSNHLAEQAQQTLATVRRFRLGDGGGSPAPIPIASHARHARVPSHPGLATGTDGPDAR